MRDILSFFQKPKDVPNFNALRIRLASPEKALLDLFYLEQRFLSFSVCFGYFRVDGGDSLFKLFRVFGAADFIVRGVVFYGEFRLIHSRTTPKSVPRISRRHIPCPRR